MENQSVPRRCRVDRQALFHVHLIMVTQVETLRYRGRSVRVIRCPVCDEPLPGFANFCAACGATLIPSPTSTTARVSRPRTLKVPHFFAVGGAGARPALDDPSLAETMKFGERPSHLPPNSTVPLGQRASVGLLEEHIGVEGSGRHANWHKIVEERPPRTPSLPR